MLSSRITVVPDTKSNQFQVGNLFHLLCYLMPQFDITDNCVSVGGEFLTFNI